MRVSIAWRIAAAFMVALVSLIIVAVVASQSLATLHHHADLVVHTYEVLGTKERLERSLAEIESAARGYVISGQPQLRERIDARRAEARRHFQQLRSLTVDNPIQQERLDALDVLIEERFEAVEQLAQLRNTGTALDSKTTTVLEQGQRISAQIRTLTGELEKLERELLASRQASATQARQQTTWILIYGSIMALLLDVLIGVWLIRSIRAPLRQLGDSADRIAQGDYAHRVQHTAQDEIGTLAAAFNAMAAQVEQRQQELAAEAWLKNGLARLAHVSEGQRDLETLSNLVLSELAQLLSAQHGVLYVMRGPHSARRLELTGTYALTSAPATLAAGERLAGQVLRERRMLQVDDVPEDYVHLGSATGTARARHIIVFPAILDNEILAVVELAAFHAFTEQQTNFLKHFSISLALVINTVIVSARTDELLLDSQRLSTSLTLQRAELAQRNDELESQGHELRTSEEMLQQQQEELKQANEELEQSNEELNQANNEMTERSRLLLEQKQLLEQSNLEIEAARLALEEKSSQLALTSKYKSEFLANMSHELRTPLNSLLILSRMLAENVDENLTEKQVQHARTIFASGNDLLRLIDDILDLSKVEAGQLDIEVEEFTLSSLTAAIDAVFKPIAESRKLEFRLNVAAQTPKVLFSDSRRLQQILKNLLANALKFTEKGFVELAIHPAEGGWDASIATLAKASRVIAFEIRDSGIGIPEDRQKIIFEAFQQAEAGTARKYGGTGLGLSISRELAVRLGGTVTLHSMPGRGSTFTLFVPERLEGTAGMQRVSETLAPILPPEPMPSHVAQAASTSAEPRLEPDLIADDRRSIVEGDPVLLIIEDDRHFAYVLAECARAKNFKVVVAGTAGAGVALARSIKPTAITLDLKLPDGDGRVVLDLLKHDPNTRHIPVHVISVDSERERSLKQGAVSFLQKPVTREALDHALNVAAQFSSSRIRKLLIVEDNVVQQQEICDVIGDGDVESTVVGTASAALRALDEQRYDCLVLDLGLPDQNGVDLIREIQRRHGLEAPPVIVYTAKALTRREEAELRGLSEAIIVKDVRSPERLLDETALFLHRVQGKLPDAKRRMLERVQREDAVLSGRKVLVVDDDLRNIFAISTALENYKMIVSYAESGREALEKLEQEKDIKAVLMDVMMPEMDGFEAIRRIRAIPRFLNLPIIMVTAKAMRGDRERCLQAGASDYVTKPVDMDQLRSLLRVWLYS